MIGSVCTCPDETQWACQQGYAETVQISSQNGVVWKVREVAVVEIHHHVLKSTTSPEDGDARRARKARNARLESSNLEPSCLARPASLARLAVEFLNCLSA